MKPYKLALFIFRRDLRLVDNTALLRALSEAERVLPIFIFDPRQIEDHKFRSKNALQFMAAALQELSADIAAAEGQLYFFSGKPDEVTGKLIESEKLQAVFVNADYTPFSRERDQRLAELCSGKGIPLISCHDALLTYPGEVLKPDGQPYTMFTPFFRRAVSRAPSAPVTTKPAGFVSGRINGALEHPWEGLLQSLNPQLSVTGSRQAALSVLKKLDRFQNYSVERDLPALSATTLLSAHNKFGTVSIREVFWAISQALGPQHPLLRQLYWRDFFYQIAFHFPHVFKGAFHPKYDALPWEDDQSKFEAWCAGRTGFPIIDAGLRELNTTGFMHNRVRMIAASFLVKDLHCNWQAGERYFASQLTDYDPAVNNGNWQWAASTGCDAQPYFRVFNPLLQQKRFDPDCVYVKRWIPELEQLSSKQILTLYDAAKADRSGYFPLLVDHAEAKERAEDMFKEL